MFDQDKKGKFLSLNNYDLDSYREDEQNLALSCQKQDNSFLNQYENIEDLRGLSLRKNKKNNFQNIQDGFDVEPESLEGMDYQINSLSGASLESNGSDLTKILTPVIVVNQPNLIEKGINFFTKFEFKKKPQQDVMRTSSQSSSDSMQSYNSINSYDSGSSSHLNPIDSDLDSLSLIYECKDDCKTIIDHAHLNEALRFTALAIDDDNWQKVCKRDQNKTPVDGSGCTDDAYQNFTWEFQQQIDQKTDFGIQQQLNSYIKKTENFMKIRKALSRDFSLQNPYSNIIIAQLKFAGPISDTKWQLNEFGENSDNNFQQEIVTREFSSQEQKTFLKQFEYEVYKKAFQFDSDKIKVYVISPGLFKMIAEYQKNQDLLIAFFIVISTWIYMSVHQGSILLSTISIIQIMASIPISIFIFSYVLKVTYFSLLHVLIVIIILGIGSDNIFVFHDTWEHTRHVKILRKRLHLRLAYTFRKSANSLFVTSITTAASFFATCISPIMPITSFGLFSGIVIIVNYLLIIFVLPCIYLFNEIQVRPYFGCWRQQLSKFSRLIQCKKSRKQKKKINLQKKEEKISKNLMKDYQMIFQRDEQLSVKAQELDKLLLDNDEESFPQHKKLDLQVQNKKSRSFILYKEFNQIDHTELEGGNDEQNFQINESKYILDFEVDNQDEEVNYIQEEDQKVRQVYALRRGGLSLLINDLKDNNIFEASFQDKSPEIIKKRQVYSEIKEKKKYCCLWTNKQNNKKQNNLSGLEILSSDQICQINYNDYVFKKHGLFMKFFDKVLSRGVYFFKKPIIVFSFFWFIACMYFATKLTQKNSETNLLRRSEQVQQAKDIIDYRLFKENDFMKLNFLFGFQNQLKFKEKSPFWDQNHNGEVKFDQNFDLSPEDNQLKLYEFCNQLQEAEYIYKNLDGQVNYFYCDIIAFKDYLSTRGMNFPVKKNLFNQIWQEYLKDKNPKYVWHDEEKNFGLMIIISVQNVDGRPFEYRKKMFQYFKKIVFDLQTEFPEGLQSVWAIPFDQWALLEFENSMYYNAIWGLLTSTVFAFVVLLFNTYNFIASFYAILTITLINGTIMAAIYLQGGGLGISDSFIIVIFTGFSFDYVVHMCHQYVESVFEKRKNRTDQIFQQIGTTIIHSAITSLLTGCLMFQMHFEYLQKFGTFMIITIISSVFFSLVLYTALSYEIGPEFKQGDLKSLILNPIKTWFTKRRLQRERQAYKNFQMTFYRRFFNQNESDEDQSQQLIQSNLNHSLDGEINNQNQSKIKKIQFFVRKLIKLVREDIKILRRQISNYYEGARDKYDEIYLFMGRQGFRNKQAKRQPSLLLGLEDDTGLIRSQKELGSLMNVIIISDYDKTYNQIVRLNNEAQRLATTQVLNNQGDEDTQRDIDSTNSIVFQQQNISNKLVNQDESNTNSDNQPLENVSDDNLLLLQNQQQRDFQNFLEIHYQNQQKWQRRNFRDYLRTLKLSDQEAEEYLEYLKSRRQKRQEEEQFQADSLILDLEEFSPIKQSISNKLQKVKDNFNKVSSSLQIFGKKTERKIENLDVPEIVSTWYLPKILV